MIMYSFECPHCGERNTYEKEDDVLNTDLTCSGCGIRLFVGFCGCTLECSDCGDYTDMTCENIRATNHCYKYHKQHEWKDTLCADYKKCQDCYLIKPTKECQQSA